MKQLNGLFPSTALTQARSVLLAGLAALALLALASATLFTHAQAAGQSRGEAENAAGESEGHSPAQEAELLQLLADFHGALSYGGDINAMMSLWADDSSITLNGTTHVGYDAVQAFFLGAGYFKNNWVSLAPEYKTQLTIHGRTAEATTQCVAIDLTATPMVVKSVIQVDAIAVKMHGKWLFTSMNNTTPAPL